MASLVSVPAADIKAFYHADEGHYLELIAEGVLPSWVLSPFFKREPWAGGLFFSLRSFSGGLGPSHEKPFKATFIEHILLPQPGFNSTSVLVETALGRFNIPIIPANSADAPGFAASEQKDASAVTATILEDVLPPIKVALTGGEPLVIPAAVPEHKGDGKKGYVEVSFNDVYFKMTNAGISDKTLDWTFQWAKFPEGKMNPQLINVTTSTWNGMVGPDSTWTRITQGYVVSYVLKA